MELIAENIGKRFNKEWIFRNISIHLKEKKSLAITGNNGSGKSTLLQLLSGISIPSEGQLRYQTKNTSIIPESFYKYISYVAPYMELIEEMNIIELATFHSKFKPFTNGVSPSNFAEKINLNQASNKEVRFFSSGMKQRVKLGLAFYSNTPILMLDEPCTNLDETGINWYLDEIKKQLNNRTILICSNQREEYSFCDETINLKK